MRQAARNSIGAVSLPAQSRSVGTIAWAMKPPRLPTELIAANPAAARAALVVGAAGAGLLYSGVVYGLHNNMKRTFMMTVRRLAGTT